MLFKMASAQRLPFCHDRNVVMKPAGGAAFQLIEAERRIYASPHWGIIGSVNDLSPIQRQAVIWTKTGLL